jgi:hypothetical protein
VSGLTLTDRLLAVLMEQPTPTTDDETYELAERLAAVANDATRQAIDKARASWEEVADPNGNRRYGADRAYDVITAALGLSPVQAGDVRYSQGMEATVVDVNDDGFVAFLVDGCRYTLTLSTFMRNWSLDA